MDHFSTATYSDRCGAAGVVQASGHGDVFRSGDVDHLQARLQQVMDRGRLEPDERRALAQWAQRLDEDAGPEYLLGILRFLEGQGVRPVTPWNRADV
ncbi:MAG: hypothetical protein P1P89_19855 [Desulfobacterales bacterium]|nr:hypothetical protein [Desulfobacterales bacterium]